VERYRKEHLPNKRQSSRNEDEALLKQWVVPELGKLRVAAVTPADMKALFATVTKSTKKGVRANRLLSLAQKMFSLSIEWDMRADNPCRSIKRNDETEHERYLSPAEFVRLNAALDKRKDQSSNVVRQIYRRAAILWTANSWPTIAFLPRSRARAV
jgi:site-specific recombinase XerD